MLDGESLTTANSKAFSASCRDQVVDLAGQRIRIANFTGTSQEEDLTLPPNCAGFGRIHHFRRKSSTGWPDDPLPMDPACRALAFPQVDMMKAQVFQCAACNYRCWYCFVSRELLDAAPHHSGMLSADRLVELYAELTDPPRVIVLSGGNPQLVPEWVPWMMRALTSCGLDSQVYLWSDDNLSNDYFWRFLSETDIDFVANYPNYGKVSCFKGFSNESFSFNTGVDAELFEYQFKLMHRLLGSGIDQFAYVTFTVPCLAGVRDDVVRFVDRLQEVDELLPLRTVPLEIEPFGPTRERLSARRAAALENQHAVAELWTAELQKRYSEEQLNLNICEVPLPR